MAVARFDANGALDPGFGNGGTVTTEVGAFDDSAVQVMVQSDGKIVVVGQTEIAANSSAINVALVRYDTAGALDPTFGSGGVASMSLGAAISAAYGAALQADDKIIVVGRVVAASTSDEFVARFDTSGALDASFGTGGVVILDFGGRGDGGHAVIVQPDGYIVVAGTSFNGPLFLDGAVATLTRLDPSGTPDPSFGTGGSVVASGPNITIFNSLVRQGDGRLVVFGASGPGAVAFKLFRYDATGAAEGGFAGGPGNFMTPISSGSLALGATGKFAMLGDNFTVTRVKSDGALDSDFALGGHVTLGIGTRGGAWSTLIEPSEDIILAGGALVGFDPSQTAMTLVRVLGSSPPCTGDQDCGMCEHCDGSGSCAIGSRAGCTAAKAGGAKLRIKNEGYRGASKLALKWRGTAPSFDPTSSDDVGICIYHYGERIAKVVAPADGDVGGGRTELFVSGATGTPDGSTKMKVTASVITPSPSRPRGRLDVARRAPLSSLSEFGPPVLLQLHLGDNACVEATFNTNRHVRRSSFTGRSD